MMNKKNAEIMFMLNLVKRFIDGKEDRMFFVGDFNHYLIEKYDDIYDENPEAAYVIGKVIGDVVDMDELTDEQLRDRVCDGYNLVLDILSGTAY